VASVTTPIDRGRIAQRGKNFPEIAQHKGETPVPGK